MTRTSLRVTALLLTLLTGLVASAAGHVLTELRAYNANGNATSFRGLGLTMPTVETILSAESMPMARYLRPSLTLPA